jgi:hypothetical protein
MSAGLTSGFLLDRQWHWMRGEMEESKRPALLALARLLRDSHVAYAFIGGLALQVHQREPRTTLAIDVAVLSRETIPKDALIAEGFQFDAAYEHSENWIGAGNTPIQFTDDPKLANAIAAADEIAFERRDAASDSSRRSTSRETALGKRPRSPAVKAPSRSR